MIEKGYHTYLDYIHDMSIDSSYLESVSVMK